MRAILIVEGNYILKFLNVLNLLEDFMAKEKFNKTKCSRVKIGVIGRVDDGRTKLIEGIAKKAMMPKGENQKSDWEMLEVEMSNNVDKSITIDNAHEEIDNLRR